MHIYVYIYTYIYVHKYVYVRRCIFIYAYIFSYVFIHMIEKTGKEKQKSDNLIHTYKCYVRTDET